MKRQKNHHGVIGILLLFGLSLSSGISAEGTQGAREDPRAVLSSSLKESYAGSKRLKKNELLTENDKNLWKKPTGGQYPPLTSETNLRIIANVTKQRIYFYDDYQLIYTMVTSSGLADEENATPLGDFEIQEIRGEHFFNAQLGEGALNYVSFKDNGVYLFHSVPVNDTFDVNVDEAVKLGQRASHGCFRLSLPDSKWFYDNVQAGTPVKVTE